jgi:hypothetical protein
MDIYKEIKDNILVKPTAAKIEYLSGLRRETVQNELSTKLNPENFKSTLKKEKEMREAIAQDTKPISDMEVLGIVIKEVEYANNANPKTEQPLESKPVTPTNHKTQAKPEVTSPLSIACL